MKITDLAFRKLIVATRLSLRTTDSVIECIEDYYCQKEEDETLTHYKKGKEVDPSWIFKEIIMQHRLKLHNYLDSLISERRKLQKIIMGVSKTV